MVILDTKFSSTSLVDWGTAAGYLLAALACGLVAARARQIFDAQVTLHRLVWAGIAVASGAFGLNEVLDLQIVFTDRIKQIAWQQDWYQLGQQAQVLFIITLVGASLLALASLAWLVRRDWRQYWLLLLGMLFVLRFVIVRAASFYGVALPELSRFTGGVRLNWLLEPLGAGIILLAAILNLRGARMRKKIPGVPASHS